MKVFHEVNARYEVKRINSAIRKLMRYTF